MQGNQVGLRSLPQRTAGVKYPVPGLSLHITTHEFMVCTCRHARDCVDGVIYCRSNELHEGHDSVRLPKDTLILMVTPQICLYEGRLWNVSSHRNDWLQSVDVVDHDV